MAFLLSCLFCGSSSSSSRHTLSSSPNLKRSVVQAATINNFAKLFEDLKCPVCFNVCVPPIHNCVNGHIICNACRQKGHVTMCPTCRQSLSFGARNRFAERFVVDYAQQCCYASQGCEHLRLKGCNMKPHEEKCMFRPIKCIVGTCGLHIPYKNFLAHLDCGHKASGTDRLPTLVQFKYNPKTSGYPKWLPYYIQAYDNIYYVMLQRVRKCYWVWVYSQLSKEADDLEYTYNAYIKLKHPEKKISVAWHGPVYSIRTPFKTIKSEGCAFTLPSPLIKNFAMPQGILNFAVDLRKVPRRSLKEVKLPGEGDSETAVVSGSLPTEYNRPPSFYEPNAHANDPSAQQEYPSHDSASHPQGSPDENGNHLNLLSTNELSHLGTSPSSKPTDTLHQDGTVPRVRPRRSPRTAAIGIPNLSIHQYPPISQTSTVTSFLDTTPLPSELFVTTSNDEGGDGDDDQFGDKIADNISPMEIQKNILHFTPT